MPGEVYSRGQHPASRANLARRRGGDKTQGKKKIIAAIEAALKNLGSDAQSAEIRHEIRVFFGLHDAQRLNERQIARWAKVKAKKAYEVMILSMRNAILGVNETISPEPSATKLAEMRKSLTEDEKRWGGEWWAMQEKIAAWKEEHGRVIDNSNGLNIDGFIERFKKVEGMSLYPVDRLDGVPIRKDQIVKIWVYDMGWEVAPGLQGGPLEAGFTGELQWKEVAWDKREQYSGAYQARRIEKAIFFGVRRFLLYNEKHRELWDAYAKVEFGRQLVLCVGGNGYFTPEWEREPLHFDRYLTYSEAAAEIASWQPATWLPGDWPHATIQIGLDFASSQNIPHISEKFNQPKSEFLKNAWACEVGFPEHQDFRNGAPWSKIAQKPGLDIGFGSSKSFASLTGWSDAGAAEAFPRLQTMCESLATGYDFDLLHGVNWIDIEEWERRFNTLPMGVDRRDWLLAEDWLLKGVVVPAALVKENVGVRRASLKAVFAKSYVDLFNPPATGGE